MIPKKELWKAIRAKCMDCSNDQPKEIRLCTLHDCALYPYRMGKRLAAKVELVERTSICQKSDLLAS